MTLLSKFRAKRERNARLAEYDTRLDAARKAHKPTAKIEAERRAYTHSILAEGPK